MIFEDPEYLSSAMLNSDLHEQYVFMLGSALSLPYGPKGRGVPGVRELVDQIKNRLSSAQKAELASRLAEPEVNAYQEAVDFLAERKGKDAVNQLIQESVLQLIKSRRSISVSPFDLGPDGALKREPEEILDAWPTPPGLEAIGNLIASFGTRFGETVLTTNFDPLIGISIRKAGGHYFRVCIPTDGDLRPNGGSVTRIVHLHGYFHNSETLHTVSQLTSARPYLEESLKLLLLRKTLVVIGYGGWDDVLMRALADLCSEPRADTRVVWCFFEPDQQALERRYGHVLQALLPASAAGRITLVRGFDANTELPKLWDSLVGKEHLLRLGLRACIAKHLGAPAAEYDAIDSAFRQIANSSLDDMVSHSWNLPVNTLKELKGSFAKVKMPVEQQVNAFFDTWLKWCYGPAVRVDLDEQSLSKLYKEIKKK